MTDPNEPSIGEIVRVNDSKWRRRELNPRPRLREMKRLRACPDFWISFPLSRSGRVQENQSQLEVTRRLRRAFWSSLLANTRYPAHKQRWTNALSYLDEGVLVRVRIYGFGWGLTRPPTNLGSQLHPRIQPRRNLASPYWTCLFNFYFVLRRKFYLNRANPCESFKQVDVLYRCKDARSL